MHVDLEVRPTEINDGGVFKQKSHMVYHLHINIEFTEEEKTAIELLGYANTVVCKGRTRTVPTYGDDKGKEIFIDHSWTAGAILRNNGAVSLIYPLELRAKEALQTVKDDITEFKQALSKNAEKINWPSKESFDL